MQKFIITSHRAGALPNEGCVALQLAPQDEAGNDQAPMLLLLGPDQAEAIAQSLREAVQRLQPTN
ncbi:hypothetical protein [Burkholderia sp.]|uniref:hypothetical protein n=1 Tax=Burkholderia sp. TaxID=36773 RepID=UPI0025C6CDFF|nr:hypothetical protein [Burkholderia sp.]MBS6363311.1 hypothetical protein [Burkholderia sp.]